MTKTAGLLMKEIQIKLEDPTFKRYSLDKLQLWMNEAIIDISRRSECLMTETSVSVTAGVQEVSAPSSVVRIHRVAYIPTGQTQEYDLQYQAYKNMSSVAWTGLRQNQGTPAIYYTWGFPPSLKINLYPIPSQNGTLKVGFFRLGATFGVGREADLATTVDLPDGWEDLVIDYVVAEGLMIDRDPRADMYKQRYNERLAAMSEAAVNFVDQAGSIVQGNTFIPQWLYDPEY